MHVFGLVEEAEALKTKPAQIQGEHVLCIKRPQVTREHEILLMRYDGCVLTTLPPCCLRLQH